MVYARLGDRLRIAGMADINGRRADVNPRRVATLRAAAAAMFPGAADFDRAVAWCGLRPATPKGLPIIDRTSFDNLWLNIGQGALGFTLALASGRLIGDLSSGRQSAILREGFGLAVTGRDFVAVIYQRVVPACAATTKRNQSTTIFTRSRALTW